MRLRFAITISAAAIGFSSSQALTLDAALAKTLKNNPRILQARAGLEAAAGERVLLRSVAYPKGLVGSVAGVEGGERSQTSGNQPFIFAYGILAQPLFEAGIPATLRRGDIGILVAQQQLNVAVVGELHRARLAFYRALYDRSLASSGEAQRERLAANIASERARYQAGETERGALTSAMLLARELEPKIESVRADYGKAVLELAQAMGGALGPGAVLPSPEGAFDFQSENVRWQDEVDRALHHRADLKLARLLVRAAREDQRIVAADYYPAVEAGIAGVAIPVTGIYRDSGGSPQATDNTLANEVGAGVTYTWRVIDNGKIDGAVARQRAVGEANKLELQKLEASVPRELMHLQNNLRAIGARYRSLLAAADVAEQNVKSVEENRAHGLASILDLRTAESDLLITQRGILSAIYEQKVALAEWDRASGRYFEFSDDTATKVH
jgi:outer membrane protein TolC